MFDTMRDSWRPTIDEIREWAFAPDDSWPHADWRLALSWFQEQERLYLRLASDNACPKRWFFLGVLYFIVGNHVKESFRGRPQPLVELLIEKGDGFKPPDIRKWQARSRELIKKPSLFDYEKWCGGGFADEGESSPAVEDWKQ